MGCTVRSGEHIVGTTTGVYKVSSVLRKAEDKRWSIDMIKAIRGSPMEPVPGSGHGKMRAFSKAKENEEPRDARYAEAPARE